MSGRDGAKRIAMCGGALAMAILALGCGGGPAPAPGVPATGAAPNPDSTPPPAATVPAELREAFMARFRAGEFDAALDAAAEALRAAPGAREPYAWSGTLCRDLGRPQRCLDLYAGVAAADRRVALAPYYSGELLRELDRPREALEAFAAATERAPDDPAPLVSAAAVHQSLGEFDEARAAVERAFRIDPGSAEIAARLAEQRRIAGDYAGARAAVEAGLAGHPDDAELLWASGLLAEREGDERAAEESWRSAIRADPSHTRAHADLARLLLRQGRDAEAAPVQAVAERLADYDSARRSLTGQISATAGPQVAVLLGELELTERRTDAAGRWFARAARLGDPGPRGWAGAAEAFYRAGDLARGDAAAARVGDAVPGRLALARAARALARGDTATAGRQLDAAVTAAPVEREFLRRAADLARETGRPELADRLLERARTAPRLSSV